MLLVEQPIDKVFDLYSAVIPLRKPVQSQHRLREIIIDLSKRQHLSIERSFIRHRSRDLIIFKNSALLRDEVDLKRSELAYPHGIPAAYQFKIHDVFKQKAEIEFFFCDQVPAKTEVDDIIF